MLMFIINGDFYKWMLALKKYQYS